MEFVTANGLRFAYLEAGDRSGRLALLLHGFPDTPYTWQRLMPSLAEAGFHAVAPFTRGYAPTEPPVADTKLVDLAADALALIPALGYERADALIGHDWGAGTAYLAATMAPERIERLVTVGLPHPATVRPTLRLLWAGRHFVSLRWPGAERRLRRNDFALIDTYYRRWSPRWAFTPNETAAVKRVFSDDASLRAAVGYYRGTPLGKPIEQFRGRTISAPTLAIAGPDDPALAADAYEGARRKFSGSYRVEELDGGHFVHRESPDEFERLVLDFIRS